ncbi:hypothetical protein D9M72_533160 [compost metagenome]
MTLLSGFAEPNASTAFCMVVWFGSPERYHMLAPPPLEAPGPDVPQALVTMAAKGARAARARKERREDWGCFIASPSVIAW